MSEHTPGPWEAEFGEAVSVLDKERGRVCTVNWLRGPHGSFGRRPDAEGEANARLIAAAPDLLAALTLAADVLEDMVKRGHVTVSSFSEMAMAYPIGEGVIPTISAAIAKATGTSD